MSLFVQKREILTKKVNFGPFELQKSFLHFPVNLGVVGQKSQNAHVVKPHSGQSVRNICVSSTSHKMKILDHYKIYSEQRCPKFRLFESTIWIYKTQPCVAHIHTFGRLIQPPTHQLVFLGDHFCQKMPLIFFPIFNSGSVKDSILFCI